MISSIELQGYRGFKTLSVQNLRRINLLVGRNNSGKTSILEALSLLMSGGSAGAMWRILMRRGEQVTETPIPGRGFQPEIEPGHLFHGHVIARGVSASIAAQGSNDNRVIRFEITDAKSDVNPALLAQLQVDTQPSLGPQFMISITGDPKPPWPWIPLNSRGGIAQNTIQLVTNYSASAAQTFPTTPHQYLTTESLSIGEVQGTYNEISLTPREEMVTDALRFIEPSLERMAVAQGQFLVGPGWPTRGGLKAKLAGIDQPIPIGSLGEGTWRMLILAMAFARSKNSLLLIDEIDTGLHYTAMPELWEFVAKTAADFDIQVFATTHSMDCLRGLAALCRNRPDAGEDVSVQRIERDRPRAVSYNSSEIVALTRDNVEAR